MADDHDLCPTTKGRFISSTHRKEKPEKTFEAFSKTRQVYSCNVRRFTPFFVQFRAETFEMKFVHFVGCYKIPHWFSRFFLRSKLQTNVQNRSTNY
jgi:hypothetical protein